MFPLLYGMKYPNVEERHILIHLSWTELDFRNLWLEEYLNVDCTGFDLYLQSIKWLEMNLLYIKPLFDESPVAVIVVGMQVKLGNPMKLWTKLNLSQNVQF